MKRVFLHILFWFCYYCQFAFTSFLFDKGSLPAWATGQLLFASLTASLMYMLPQMLFPYYMIYYGIEKLLKRKRKTIISAVEIAVVLFLCVLLDRCITKYIAIPYLYNNEIKQAPLLEVKRLIFPVVYIGFAFGLMFAVKSVRNQLAAKEREKNLIKEKLETELKFLRNQTNPHFLLNTLNNIYALARKKSDDTPEVVMRLSELLRFMLYESNANLIKLNDEIKLLEDYLALETLRYNERLTISFQKETDNDNYKITPLLLMPFLENAFTHGVSETRFESFINVDIKAAAGWLEVEIENTKGDIEQKDTGKTIGLINVTRRLELTYSDYKLDVQNNADTFKIILRLNLDSYVEI